MSPQELAALKSHYDNYKAPPVQKQRGRGGFLSSLISEISGGGGAAIGAGLGSFLGPLGTIAGGALGGFIGGTGGRVVENEVRDGRLGLGDALKEGALSGALSGAGEVFSAVKGAKAARNAAKGIGELAGETAIKAPAKVGTIEGIGKSMQAGASGIGVGATAKGEAQLTAKGSEEMATLLKDLGIKAASPEKQSAAIGNKISNLTRILDEKYAGAGVKYTTSEAKALQKQIMDKIATAPGLTQAGKKYAESEVANLVKNHVKDPKTLWEYIKGLEDNGINFAASSESKIPGQEAVNRIIRDNVRGKLNNSIKGLAETNQLYSKARTAEKYLLKASADVKGGGLASRVMSLSPVKSAESKIGATLSTGGRYAAGTGGFGSRVTNNMLRQAPGAALRTGAPEPPQDLTQSSDPMMQDQGMSDPTTAPQRQYGLREALMDAQGLLGSNQTPATYLTYAKELMSQNQTAGNGGSPNITKVTAQQYGLAQRGSQSLEQMANLLQQDPDVLKRTATPGRKLPVVGGFISNAAKTGDFDAIGYNVASALLRLETGAQANESEIRNLQSQLIPRAGDSQHTVARKLQQLNQAFNTYLNSAGVPEQGQLAGALQ